MAFGTSCDSAAMVTEEVKKNSSVPVMVKLSPNVTDIAAMAKAVESAGADAISLINTLLGMRINIETGRPILHNNTGGLSGPAVLPVAVRMVWQVANAVNVPILGMGGISRWQDGVEMLMAGADMVSVGTACFADPMTPLKVRDGIEEYLNRKNILSVTDLTGKVVLN
jgi:dihydroorotate dehydrogenase (NAD+) catalytic subunit